jgi:NAD(P)H-dependent flavin oxidoreductase YrpB (nitropropane dioxygenase family)
MKLDSAYIMLNQVSKTSSINSVSQAEALKEEVSATQMSDYYLVQYLNQSKTKSKDDFTTQIDILSKLLNTSKQKDSEVQITPFEANELVSENGFFGVSNTAQRIADFVLKGAGEDVNLLKAGREGVLQGFQQAKDMWGDELPDISYQTIHKAISSIDKRLSSLGAGILDSNA